MTIVVGSPYHRFMAPSAQAPVSIPHKALDSAFLPLTVRWQPAVPCTHMCTNRVITAARPSCHPPREMAVVLALSQISRRWAQRDWRMCCCGIGAYRQLYPRPSVLLAPPSCSHPFASQTYHTHDEPPPTQYSSGIGHTNTHQHTPPSSFTLLLPFPSVLGAFFSRTGSSGSVSRFLQESASQDKQLTREALDNCVEKLSRRIDE